MVKGYCNHHHKTKIFNGGQTAYWQSCASINAPSFQDKGYNNNCVSGTVQYLLAFFVVRYFVKGVKSFTIYTFLKPIWFDHVDNVNVINSSENPEVFWC